jgi:hypothetical protein
MPVYHGTDEDSAQSIVANGLDQQAWETAAGGAGPDPKGFSVTDNLEVACDWARYRALERLGDPDRGVVLEADPSKLPLSTGQPGLWTDPGERFIRPEDFPQVGPGVFQPAP